MKRSSPILERERERAPPPPTTARKRERERAKKVVRYTIMESSLRKIFENFEFFVTNKMKRIVCVYTLELQMKS
jgi:hypothetical protein